MFSATRSDTRFRLPSLLASGLTLLMLGIQTLPAHAQAPFEMDIEAPELVGGPWINTPKNAPIKLASRQGKVTVVEFWTFG